MLDKRENTENTTSGVSGAPTGSGSGSVASSASTGAASNNHSDTLYLCNFRVSVDGDWLCLKEVDDQDSIASTVSSDISRSRKPPDSLAITPELDRLEKIYPNYPVGNPKGEYLTLTYQK